MVLIELFTGSAGSSQWRRKAGEVSGGREVMIVALCLNKSPPSLSSSYEKRRGEHIRLFLLPLPEVPFGASLAQARRRFSSHSSWEFRPFSSGDGAISSLSQRREPSSSRASQAAILLAAGIRSEDAINVSDNTEVKNGLCPNADDLCLPLFKGSTGGRDEHDEHVLVVAADVFVDDDKHVDNALVDRGATSKFSLPRHPAGLWGQEVKRL